MKACTSRLGFSLCGIVSTIAMASTAPPARADDLIPSLPNATPAAVATSAALDVTDATMPTPAGAAPATADAIEIPVVLPVATTILPTIPAVEPASPPATASPETAPAEPPVPPAPQTPPVPQPDPAPDPVPVPTVPAQPTPPAVDTANTTTDNSNGITTVSPQEPADISSQTFTWNWTWNCDPDVTPTVPALPPGTTTIVWNWHWACSDVTPPPLTVAGITICTSCNIAISLRIASPGDSGTIAQTIAAQAAATVAQVATAVQEAAQSPPPPPPAAAVAPPASAAAPSDDPTASVLQMQIDDGPAAPSVELLSVDDAAPRHGGAAFVATLRTGAAKHVMSHDVFGGPIRSRPLRPPVPVVIAAAAAPATAAGPRRAAGAVSAPTRSLPPPSPPAPGNDVPVPAVIALSPVGPQHPASSGFVALAIGAVGVPLLLFISYLVPLSRVVRARAGVAEPHPPG